jgi:hypothetical protein
VAGNDGDLGSLNGELVPVDDAEANEGPRHVVQGRFPSGRDSIGWDDAFDPGGGEAWADVGMGRGMDHRNWVVRVWMGWKNSRNPRVSAMTGAAKIEHATVAGQRVGEVLEMKVAFDGGKDEVADSSGDRNERAEGDKQEDVSKSLTLKQEVAAEGDEGGGRTGLAEHRAW